MRAKAGITGKEPKVSVGVWASLKCVMLGKFEIIFGGKHLPRSSIRTEH